MGPVLKTELNRRGFRRGPVAVGFYGRLLLAACLLSEAPAVSGESLRGFVHLEGGRVPHAWVRIVPDERPWAGEDAFGGGVPHPGPSGREFLSPTGAFEVEGLGPGNYSLSARFQFASDVTLTTLPLPHRVSVGEDGLVQIFDSLGNNIPERKFVGLEIHQRPIPEGREAGRFRGVAHAA